MMDKEKIFDLARCMRELAQELEEFGLGMKETLKEEPPLKLELSKEMSNIVEVTDSKTHWIIKPITFLGSDRFRTVAAEVKALGGIYVSAGKDSHFRIDKRQKP
jgi:hypothetical protein